MPARINASFLLHLAAGGFGQGLIKGIATASDGLPEARVIRPLHHQHMKIRRVDDDENGNGNLVRHDGLAADNGGRHERTAVR